MPGGAMRNGDGKQQHSAAPASHKGDDGSVISELDKDGALGDGVLDPLTDAIGVPYYHNGPEFPEDRAPFIHYFFLPKVVDEVKKAYSVLKDDSGKAAWRVVPTEKEKRMYPPLTFDRRVTMNNWRTLLTEAMLLAGLRLAALQANLQAIMALVSNPVYEDVPLAYKLGWLIALSAAFVIWACLGFRSAVKYGGFRHPDTKVRRFISLMSSTILVMFAIPNDVILLPIHALPVDQGGLLAESSCISGNWRWPVLTIAHTSKQDHDYTNKAGVDVQLPLFLIVDLGCTVLNVWISVNFGILNYTALIQMSLCSIYAIRQIYLALVRARLRARLLVIWRKTATDPNMNGSRQLAAKNKFIAEGGDKKALFKDLQAMVEQSTMDKARVSKLLSNRSRSGSDSKMATADEGRQRTNDEDLTPRSKSMVSLSATCFLDEEYSELIAPELLVVGDGSGVPYFHPDHMGHDRYRRFAHCYYVGKERLPGGGYGPKVDEDGKVSYSFKQPTNKGEYPPQTFDRRVTLNNWQEMLVTCMLEAGFRNMGLQANVMMAILMLENPLYDDMPLELWIIFVVLLFLGLGSWLILGFKRALTHWDFVHPDTRFKRCLAVCSSATLMMFAMPNDVVLFPLQLLPLKKGGLLVESGLIDGCNLWPVHTISHFSKQDHDFINTNDSSTQVPLFIFIDLGCTITNLLIALKIGVFNFTALMQMCTCGAYAFVKLREIILRQLLKKELLRMWLRTALDDHMAEHRRQAATAKYILNGGSQSALTQKAPSIATIVTKSWSRLSASEARDRAVLSHDPH